MDTRISATPLRTAGAGAGESVSADGAAPPDAFAGLLAALGQAAPAPASPSQVAIAGRHPAAEQEGAAALTASTLVGQDAGNAWPPGGQTLPLLAGPVPLPVEALGALSVPLGGAHGLSADAAASMLAAPTHSVETPLSLAPGAGRGERAGDLLEPASASVPRMVGRAEMAEPAVTGARSTVVEGGTPAPLPLPVSVADGPGHGRQRQLTPLPGISDAAPPGVPAALRTALGQAAGGEPGATVDQAYPNSTPGGATSPSTAAVAALTEAAASAAATASAGNAPVAGTPAATTAGSGGLAGAMPAAAVPAGAAADAAAGTAPSASLDAVLGSARWQAAVGQRLSAMISRGEHVAELVLDPPHLGRLEVRVALQQDQTSVSFVSASAQVRDALESAVPRLRELLGEGGFDLVNVNISFGQGQAQGQGEGERSAAGGADSDLHAGDTVADAGAVGAGDMSSIDAPTAHRGIDAYV